MCYYDHGVMMALRLGRWAEIEAAGKRRVEPPQRAIWPLVKGWLKRRRSGGAMMSASTTHGC